jgi:hypothetical protein
MLTIVSFGSTGVSFAGDCVCALTVAVANPKPAARPRQQYATIRLILIVFMILAPPTIF